MKPKKPNSLLGAVSKTITTNTVLSSASASSWSNSNSNSISNINGWWNEMKCDEMWFDWTTTVVNRLEFIGLGVDL